jgi:hypothetical protein
MTEGALVVFAAWLGFFLGVWVFYFAAVAVMHFIGKVANGE